LKGYRDEKDFALLFAVCTVASNIGNVMKPMMDEHFNADSALAILKEVYLREGTDAAVKAAIDMISAGAAWIAQESGADETRRILQAAGSAQS
jgi:hypothetical protein